MRTPAGRPGRRGRSGPPRPDAGREDRNLEPGRAGDRACLRVDAEPVLGKCPCGRGGGGHLGHRGDALLGQVGQQRLRHRRIPGVGRADVGGTDDLAVGVDGHMALVAIKATGVRLVPMAGLGVDHADDPSRCHPGAITKRPSAVSSMSWPITVANNSAAWATSGPSCRPRRASGPGSHYGTAHPPAAHAPVGRPSRTRLVSGGVVVVTRKRRPHHRPPAPANMPATRLGSPRAAA
jgi:hypothetical protein